MSGPCPEWCTEKTVHATDHDPLHSSRGAWAGGDHVFAGVRQWDGEAPQVRMHADIGGETVGGWLDANAARVVAQALDTLTRVADRRAIAAELRADADLLDMAAKKAAEAEAG